MDFDKRLSARSSLNTVVVLSHPSFGEVTVKSKDVSDGGLSIYLNSSVFPPVGTVVDVLIKSLARTVNVEPVKMRIMHIQSGMAGLKFV